MTHLRIENQNSNTEIVSSAIIQKLYTIALSAEGDVSLKGNLQSDHVKQIAYDYLTGNLPNTNVKRFPDLTLNVTGGIYIDFEDSAVEQICVSNWGDGTGITLAQVQSVTGMSDTFRNNVNITSFNELQYFTGLTNCPRFDGCTNLTSIQLPSTVTVLGDYYFNNCSNLTTIGDISNIERISSHTFTGCSKLVFDGYSFTSLKNSDISGCKFTDSNDWIVIDGTFTTLSVNNTKIKKLEIRGNFQGGSFGNNTSLTDIILPETTTSLNSKGFQYCTSISNITIKATTPPTFGSQLFFNANRRPNIYVPSGSVSSYQSASGWVDYADKIQAIPTT